MKSCLACDESNKGGKITANVSERLVLHASFEEACIDIVGPQLTGKGGNKYLVIYLCSASRWTNAVPLRSISAKEVGEALMTILTKTCLPLEIVSDQSSQFVGSVMRYLCKLLGIVKVEIEMNSSLSIPL